MKFDRSSGILLHPTSLPGPFGIGDLGHNACKWIDFLSDAGCALWQVLPLGPTGYGDSPYQCFSAFAGNPYLISPDLLHADGLLEVDDINNPPPFPPDRVDYGQVIQWKLSILDRAYDHFQARATSSLRAEYEEFQFRKASWLDDFALFMMLKEMHGGAAWVTWAEPYRKRDPKALDKAKQANPQIYSRQVFRQFLFFRQLHSLRDYLADKGIKVIGDIPIFVAHDSADVWAHPELFFLRDSGEPTFVAGVPPDYFSATGQLWGNPLYNWKIHAADGYSWWLARLGAVLEMVDIVRLDHFRGFAGYWQIPGGEKTAIKGRWVKGPGKALFSRVKDSLGDLPIIAEDLGVITPDVVDMRDHFGLPGMKILQFGFESDPSDPFLPHNYETNCVAYTGTHDNDTVLGWFERVPEKSRDFCLHYLDSDGTNISWDMIRSVWSSVAVFALAPMQDLLSLGNTARMNYPGNPSGNWSWRMPVDALSERLCKRIKGINYLYSRENITP